MSRLRVGVSVAFGVALLASPLYGQAPDIRQQLIARGAPQEFADRVSAIVAAAERQGLPGEPVATKALEGWAKRGRVPLERVLTVLTELSGRLGTARDVTVAAGHDPPPASLVAAAAEGLGRGLTSEDVREVIAAAPTPEAAAAGLTVAASLAAQGLETAAAVRAVRDAYGGGRPPEQVFELPSAVTELISRGVPMSDIARRILEGGGLPIPVTPGVGATGKRPGFVPPARGPITDRPPPGRRPRKP